MSKSIDFPQAAEVFLPRAPLVRVLAQVRFEQILSIQNQLNIASFQDSIREIYPVFRADHSKTFVSGPTGMTAIEHPAVWRFSDLTESWKVSLAPDFLAVETTTYSSREEFLGRFNFVLSAFFKYLKPGVINRIGIRYIDRLTGDSLGALSKMIRPELLGVLATATEVQVVASASEAMFNLNGNQLFTRWGLLPANSTIDPTVLEPINKESWILDIDASSSQRLAWDQDKLRDTLNGLASSSYNFFRWAVTNDFLKAFGAKI